MNNAIVESRPVYYSSQSDEYRSVNNRSEPSSLNGAQVVLAVQIYRIAENRRKRPENTDPVEARFAFCFIAMQMGRRLLRDLRLTKVEQINHLNFNDGNQLSEADGGEYYSESLTDIKFALSCLYKEDVSLQQLSAR